MRVQANVYPGGKRLALTMSYDDGFDFDRRLIGIFNQYGIKGTFHLNSSNIGRPGYVTPEEISDLYAGHEVSVHTLTHPFLELTSTEELVHEVVEDRKKLETLVGYPVRGMSYPFGTYNQKVIDQIRALGIVYSRTTQATKKGNIPDDFLTWHPTCHHNDEIMKLLDSLTGTTKNYPGRLFYIWGHSYEFQRNDTWKKIEEFCAAVAGREDIWFATNIEIYDYIMAQRALTLSADRTMAYNPSAISVWLLVDGKPVECKSGVVTKLGK